MHVKGLPGIGQTSQVPSARQWSPWKKRTTVVIVAVFAFITTFASSTIAPAREKLQHDFAISATVAVVPFAIYNLGLAFGSIITSTLSEHLGRSGVYKVCMTALLLFVLGTGFSKSIACVIICRFLAGFFASPGITIASAVIADMYAPEHRGLPLFSYYSMPWLGSVVGALVSYPVVAVKSWQWTQWVFLMIFGPITLVFFLFLDETYQAKVERKLETQTAEDGNTDITNDEKRDQLHQGFSEFITKNVYRPLQMLFTEPIVELTCLYAGFNFGLVYSLIIASPDVFASTYDFGYTAQGLSFLGLIVGCILGTCFLIIDNKFLFQAYADANSSVAKSTKYDLPRPGQPERRLHSAMLGGCLLPVGLIWFAWTARPSIHWICPIISQSLITCGAIMIYVSFSAYLTDTYGPKYSASAQSANAITRYLFATAVPLFISQMYHGLGTGWATSVLALCALLMCPIPFVFYVTGVRLRQRCRFKRES